MCGVSVAMADILSQMKDITILSQQVTIRGAVKAEDISALETLADELVK